MPEAHDELDNILLGCRENNRNSQRQLYERFYGYAMNVCLRFAWQPVEAKEILNDAFFKVFTRLDRYDPSLPFRSWFRRILINSAIDHFRKYHAQPATLDLMSVEGQMAEEMPLPALLPDEDVLPILGQLSPAYRMVFNLYVIEEYPHRDIARMLGIDERTSRSNLARAKEKIRALILEKSVK